MKKWLCLPEIREKSSEIVIVKAARLNDERFGVEPQEKSSKRKIQPRNLNACVDLSLLLLHPKITEMMWI